MAGSMGDGDSRESPTVFTFSLSPSPLASSSFFSFICLHSQSISLCTPLYTKQSKSFFFSFHQHYFLIPLRLSSRATPLATTFSRSRTSPSRVRYKVSYFTGFTLQSECYPSSLSYLSVMSCFISLARPPAVSTIAHPSTSLTLPTSII